MNHRAAIKWAQNPLLAVLLLVTFCARAIVPTGFMPGPGGFVICSGDMPAMGTSSTHAMTHDMSAMDMPGMDMSGMDMNHGDHLSRNGTAPDHKSWSFCPFGAAASTMVSGHVTVVAAFVHHVVTQIDLPFVSFIPRGTIVPTRLPRGPPSLA